jgi:hypothetical protein
MRQSKRFPMQGTDSCCDDNAGSTLDSGQPARRARRGAVVGLVALLVAWSAPAAAQGDPGGRLPRHVRSGSSWAMPQVAPPTWRPG